jgi:hypothetical protein
MRESLSAVICHRFTLRGWNLALIARLPFNNPGHWGLRLPATGSIFS